MMIKPITLIIPVGRGRELTLRNTNVLDTEKPYELDITEGGRQYRLLGCRVESYSQAMGIARVGPHIIVES